MILVHCQRAKLRMLEYFILQVYEQTISIKHPTDLADFACFITHIYRFNSQDLTNKTFIHNFMF